MDYQNGFKFTPILIYLAMKICSIYDKKYDPEFSFKIPADSIDIIKK